METFKLFSNEHFILIISNILFFTFLLFIANFFNKRYFAKISAIKTMRNLNTDAKAAPVQTQQA